MAKPKDRIHRRNFLKTGAASLAALGSTRLWGKPLVGAELPTRRRSIDATVLRSSILEVTLDSTDGLPYEYHFLASGAGIRGEDLGEQISVTLFRRRPRGFATAPVAASSVKANATQADFLFNASYDGKPAAAFVVRYVLDGPTVYLSLEAVEEHEGYELIEVAMPRLATVREEDGPAWLAHGDDGGSLALLSDAKAGQLQPNTFWGNVLATLPVVMVGTGRLICVQEVTSYMDDTALAVMGEEGHRRAALGTIKTHRVNGSLCHDMNTGPGTPRVCGAEKTPNLLVGQRSVCCLDFMADFDGNGTVDWLDGAKLVRKRMPPIPTRYYDDKLVYGIHCDEPQWEKPGATFEQCATLIRDVAALTDYSPQLVHLWGWQYRGKDTGYPAVAEVNPRIGGYEALMRLMQEARKLNCNATFSDNYDDAYRSSPAWDPANIARRPDGELWKSRNWTGEDSYIAGLAKYMKGPGLDRARYTCERYKLRESTHIDVLSYFPIRNDWDPEHPASGIKNLLEGRYKVLEEFSKHGVDVSSEALRYAFIGKISSYWYAQGPRPCPFGGKPIPLLPTIYRQSAVWGQSGRSAGYIDRLLNMLFYNACPHTSITSDTDRSQITDLFYLALIPWFKLHARNIESFRREGDRTLIGLEGNASIDLDWKNKTYSASIDGTEITRDGSTFCPLDEGRMAFYTLSSRELAAPLPKAWDAATIASIALSVDKREELRAAVEGGRVKLSMPARRPVMVYRDGKSARKRLLQS